MDSVTGVGMDRNARVLAICSQRKHQPLNHFPIHHELTRFSDWFERCETSKTILQLLSHDCCLNILCGFHGRLSVCWGPQWVRISKNIGCQMINLLFFSFFSDGDNFVYMFLDWREYPYEAVSSAVMLMLLAVGLHCLFNEVHYLRKKLCMIINLRRAIHSVIWNLLKVVSNDLIHNVTNQA
jgi:hypothetical protein